MSLSIQPVASQAYAESATSRPGREAGGNADTQPAARKSVAQAASPSDQDLKVIEQLKSRDREVRAHEQAHAAAAGGLALGGPSYTYQYGPDGQAYAVGGEVNIDTSPGNSPEATIAKAKQIRAAALAPADPSGQDRAVAAAASQLEAQAQQELTQKTLSGLNPDKASSDKNTSQPESDDSSSIDQDKFKARQAAALYGAIASAPTQGGLISVSA